MSPPLASISAGPTQQFTAMGTYVDLSTKNLTNSVTWSTSKAATATISCLGLATGVANGVVTVAATDPSSSIPGMAQLLVLAGTPGPTMSPSTGAKRTLVNISGTGFTAGQTVTITYMSGRKRPKRASSVLCAASVGKDGTFTCNGAIPKKGRAGAVGQKSVVGATSSAVTSTVVQLT